LDQGVNGLISSSCEFSRRMQLSIYATTLSTRSNARQTD
jgi:hypothetical protein